MLNKTDRISDLKRQGYPIISNTETVNNRYEEKCRIKRYSLDRSTGKELTNGKA